MPTPEEIAQRRFLVSLRGYDRDQVHDFLGDVSRQVADLEQRGEELAAENERLAAELELARASAAAAEPGEEQSSERPYAALGEETQRVLEAAQEAATAITRKARQDADRQVQQARRDAAKVIADGERRREQADQAVTRLEEQRAELARDLAGVGRAIEQILSGLIPPEEIPTVREALTDADAGDQRHVAEDDAQDSRTVGPEEAAGAPAAPDMEAEPAVVADAEPLGEALAGEAEEAEPAVVADAEPLGQALAGEAEDVEPAVVADAEPLGEALAGEAEEAEPTAADDAEPLGEALAGEAEEGGEPEPAPQEAGPEPAAAVVPGTEEIPPAERDPEDASTPVSLRAGALEPLHPKMMRRLKRGMSDLQNVALDRMRRSSPKDGAEDLVPRDDEMGVLAAVGEEFLDQAYEAGVEAAAVLAGRRLGSPDRSRSLEADFSADAGARIRDSLLESLRIGLEGGEPISVLNDRIGAVFSELKSTAADELSAVHLIRAYEIGLLDAWAAGGVDERVWMLGRELRCPEGRCRQNDETGAVDVAEAFPSGHEVPPVHVGCTCTTIPSLES